jgi:hypothetical protein
LAVVEDKHAEQMHTHKHRDGRDYDGRYVEYWL